MEFYVRDANKTNFEKGSFDIIYSSRGPLSASFKILSEAMRILKKKGLLIEETIGECDKIEIKEILQRGQDYPVTNRKLNEVKKLLKKIGATVIFSKDYKYTLAYMTIQDIINLLQRAPIVPDFDEEKDAPKLNKLKTSSDGIHLTTHRLQWVAQNNS